MAAALRRTARRKYAIAFRLGWGAVSGRLDSAVSLVAGWVDEGVIPGAALLVSRGDVGSHVPAVRRLQIGLRTVPGVGGVPVILMSGSDGLLTLLARHCPER